MSDSQPGVVRPTREQLQWLLLWRVVVVSIFLGGTFFFHLRSGLSFDSRPFLLLLVAISLTYCQAVVSALYIGRVRRLRLFAQTQFCWDLILASALIFLSGGSDSVFSFLYLLLIVGSSIYLSRREVFVIASASVILFGSLVDLQYYGYLPFASWTGSSVEPLAPNVAFYKIFINVIAYFLTAALSGTLSERLRRSEQALVRRQIDYEELENLNQTILESINSGLMVINAKGRIRSFNSAASRISGYQFQDVYDGFVGNFFPGVNVYSGDRFLVVGRAQTVFTNQSGEELVLGYASSPVNDARGMELGLLVVFQDLTQVVHLEDQLKRADRLAAVGRLASGMAHEIRNPLASISGSVQLLMENGHVTEDDRRLMGIVVKEADRLSQLLSEFLLFARPKAPSLALVDISLVFDEITQMLKSDRRFEHIKIQRDYPPSISLVVDRHQIKQALWDLVINAAEAMPQGGLLSVGVDSARSMLWVEDSGEGIGEELRGKIFDPFFTTKDHGSGLGLATVYSIVDAHRGLIAVSTGRFGGARFELSLPAERGLQ